MGHVLDHLSKGLEHLWILVSAEGPRTNPATVPRDGYNLKRDHVS